MSSVPVETHPYDEPVMILLDASVLDALVQTIAHLPPGTPLVMQGRSTHTSQTVHATSVLRAIPSQRSVSKGGSLALVDGLSTAERRVLQYLRSHLTLAEIGSRLFVSRNTVKSQAISIYRKLGVSSRGEAVRIAFEADLSGASSCVLSTDHDRTVAV